MATFLFITWDGGGNVPPELSIVRKLIGRGHQVRLLGDPTLEPEARDAGCDFSPWTTAPHRTTRDRSGDLIRDYAFKNPVTAIGRYMNDFLAAPAPRWVADTMAVLTQHPPDVVVADIALPSALIAAEKLGIPAAVLCPNIWIIPTPGIPPLGGKMPATGPIGHVRERIMRRLITSMFNKALPALNQQRADQGLAPVASTHEQMLRAKDVLVLTSPRFDFTSPHLPKHVSYAGPQLDDPHWTEPWRSPWPETDTRPLVLVGLSSTYQRQNVALGRIVDALSGMPVRALVTLGEAIKPEEVQGRNNVTVVRSAPHNQVLPHTSVLITHCGHGTTLKGLAAGVPMVCMPMGRDQDDTAARVVHRGAGVRLKPTASARSIRSAVEKVLATQSYRENARQLAAALQAGDGCVDPVERLERLVGVD